MSKAFVVNSNYARRQKLFSGEKNNFCVIPEDFSKNDISSFTINESRIAEYKDSFNVFCAGDFLENAFVDEIKVFASYNWYFNKKSHLFLILQEKNSIAENSLKSLAEKLGISKRVVFAWESDFDFAKALFSISSVVISLKNYSKNQLYCYEAMKSNKVCIASGESSIPEILNGSGIVVTKNDIRIIGSLLDQISSNSILVKEICSEQIQQAKKYDERVKLCFESDKSENNKNESRTILFDSSNEFVDFPDVRIFEERIPFCHELKGALNILKFGNSLDNLTSENIDYINKFFDGIGTENDEQTEKLVQKGIIIPVKTIKNSDWNDFIEEIYIVQKRISVAMVTTWNSRCGIAEYTKMEVMASIKNIDYEIFPNYGVELFQKDEPFVKARLWKQDYNEDLNELAKSLLQSKSEFVHIQFHYGLFQKLSSFANLIEKLVPEKKVIITFHKTADNDFITRIESLTTIVSSLNKCTALVVHAEDDKKRLESFGVTSDIKIIAHGQIVYPDVVANEQRKKLGINSSLVIGSYGFLVPHKGILEAIQSIKILKKDYPDILYMPVCSLSGRKDSQDYYERCLLEIKNLGLKKNVRMITDFLPNDESMKYLKACDIMVMPYKPTQESASGAVRFCLAASRPMVTSKQKIFDEFKECSFRIEDCKPELISEGIKQVLNPSIKEKLLKNEKDYIMKTSWYSTARKFYDLYASL